MCLVASQDNLFLIDVDCFGRLGILYETDMHIQQYKTSIIDPHKSDADRPISLLRDQLQYETIHLPRSVTRLLTLHVACAYHTSQARMARMAKHLPSTR